MKKAIYRKRLLKLIEHLEHGKLGHPKFDFSCFDMGLKVNHCRTNGCAAGELPVIFPALWFFKQHNSFYEEPEKFKLSYPRLIERPRLETFSALALFFGVNKRTAEEMFCSTVANGLAYRAKRQTVAKHLRTFLSPEAKTTLSQN